MSCIASRREHHFGIPPFHQLAHIKSIGQDLVAPTLFSSTIINGNMNRIGVSQLCKRQQLASAVSDEFQTLVPNNHGVVNVRERCEVGVQYWKAFDDFTFAQLKTIDFNL
jgi:hypothetical protein